MFILAIIYLSGCVAPYLQTSQIPFLAPTATKACYFGNFKTIELPEQSLDWKTKLSNTGIKVINVRFMAFGETVNCSVGGKNEAEEIIIQFVELEMIISVGNIDNDELLVDILKKVMGVIENYREESPIRTVLLTFTTDQSRTKILKFNTEQAKHLQDESISNKALLEMLENK